MGLIMKISPLTIFKKEAVMVKKTKETLKNMGKTAFAFVTMENLSNAVKSEMGQQATKTLFGKVFNIGPNDEAIMDNAISEISKNPQIRAKIRIRFDEFFADMKKNNFSVEWFKAVMVKKNRDWKLGSKNKSPAAETLSAIDRGKNFEEKVKIATSELMHKTIKSRLKEGWQVVMGEDGKMKLLVDSDKINAFFSSTGSKIKTAKDNFKSGVKGNFWWSWGIMAVLSVIIFFVIKSL